MNIITEKGYVDYAERVIKSLKERRDDRGKPIVIITTSKIRNLLAMSADIYNVVIADTNEELSKEVCSRTEYLRMRFVYEAGRDGSVKKFVEEAKLLDILKQIDGKKANFILFNHYMEALVAFHRYYGGKD